MASKAKRYQCCNSAYRLRYWNNILKILIFLLNLIQLQQCLPFTVLKRTAKRTFSVRFILLQQCLPFTVLKRWRAISSRSSLFQLQQCLPFTVLKRVCLLVPDMKTLRCNSAYRLRYWNGPHLPNSIIFNLRCNSTYRLQYWNKHGLGFQGLNIFKVAKSLTVCDMYGILIESLVLV